MKDIRLTPTSYIVLGLLAEGDEATPYDLKTRIAKGIGNLWSLQHTQLYSEPERLTKAGYLTERREEGGRRRKLYTITPAGCEAFRAWLSAEPGAELPELRDISLLKVFFGADPGPIAREQAEAHRAKLREYQELEQELDGIDDAGPLTALRAGIGHETEWVRYWADLADEADDLARTASRRERTHVTWRATRVKCYTYYVLGGGHDEPHDDGRRGHLAQGAHPRTGARHLGQCPRS
jgi:PadR family transcriptional regulator, regulatory protein AphA